ncbi:MAG: Gfo/Idh/MocA family oxidoreductase [Clostridia bacterium]|nr:Gfo/Idh/MocA family oxidoreductase [Clostridia bacterium]
MIKIGFIDYYLDQWHANNYPEIIKECSDKYEVCCAYGTAASPITGGTNAEWSEKYGIPLVDTIEEVIEKSDCLVVLAPNNPELHENLCRLPLASGKPVYVDKTFAPDVATAKRIFDHARKHNTPVWSASALAFSDELKAFNKENISFVRTVSGGKYETHIIHQIEPVIVLMDEKPKRVMYTGTNEIGALAMEFSGGRIAQLMSADTQNTFNICYKDCSVVTQPVESPFFKNFVQAMLDFFDTKVPPVSEKQTLAVIAVMEVLGKAKENPFTWVEI